MTFGRVDLAFKNVTDNMWEVLKVNYCSWPLINFLNFKYVPIKYRVLCVNFCGLLWNAFLAHINQRSADKIEN